MLRNIMIIIIFTGCITDPVPRTDDADVADAAFDQGDVALDGAFQPDGRAPDLAVADGGMHDSEMPDQPVDCRAFAFRGETYDCSPFGTCGPYPEDLQYRLACCTCDREYCDPPCTPG